MNSDYIIDQLEANMTTFKGLFQINLKDEHLWKPGPDTWCLLEIICHLVDEEVFDFRARVQTALDVENFPLKAIDPVGWVLSKKYIEQDYSRKVEEWMVARQQSVDWLRSLQNPNWNCSFTHPQLGEMSAGLFLSNWLAHDQLHIRQITRLKRAILHDISDEDLGYAGNW